MSSHGNGYADVDLRDAINRGDIDGPRFQVSGRGIRWSAEPPDPKAPDNPLAEHGHPLARGRARGCSRCRRARRRLDQAVSRRRVLVWPERRRRST